MSSLADILNTSRQALRVQQLAMQLIGQNTANVNTEGYTRRRVELTTAPPYTTDTIWGTGNGVDTLTLGRVRDQLLDEQYRRSAGTAGYWSSRDDLLGRVEEVFSELGGSAISDRLQQFWAAWQDLANDPEGSAPRIVLLERAQALASSVRRAHSELATRHEEIDRQLVGDVQEVNALTKRIAELNVQIVRAETGGTEASDLRDMRDSAIDRLSQLLDITVHENADGALNVYNGGQILVQLDHSADLTMSSSSSNGLVKTQVTYGSSGRALVLDSGEIKSLIELRDQDIGGVMADLDGFAVAMANRVNEVHRTGYGLTGTNGIEFFASDVTGASDFRVSQMIADEPDRIATAAADGAPGDNSIALQIAGIQSEKLMRDGRSTLDEYYRDISLAVGSKKSYAVGQLAVEQGALDSISNRRQQVSGVSMDEEMTRLIQVQQAYEAAAKVITTVDEMMQTVLAMGAGA